MIYKLWSRGFQKGMVDKEKRYDKSTTFSESHNYAFYPRYVSSL